MDIIIASVMVVATIAAFLLGILWYSSGVVVKVYAERKDELKNGLLKDIHACVEKLGGDPALYPLANSLTLLGNKIQNSEVAYIPSAVFSAVILLVNEIMLFGSHSIDADRHLGQIDNYVQTSWRTDATPLAPIYGEEPWIFRKALELRFNRFFAAQTQK